MWTDRRRLWLGLAGSLLLNVFLIGLVVGRGMAWHRERVPPSSGPAPIGASRYVEALPEDQKAVVKAALAAHREAIREARRHRREVRAKADADISAPTLERATVEADLTALHQSNRAIEDAISAALIEALPRLTPQARATLVGRGTAAPAPR